MTSKTFSAFQAQYDVESRKYKVAHRAFWNLYRLLQSRDKSREHYLDYNNTIASLCEEGIEYKHFIAWQYSARAKKANRSTIALTEAHAMKHNAIRFA